jgi:hypothetical protein
MKKDRGLLARVPPMGCEIIERVRIDPAWEIDGQYVREGIGGGAAVQWGRDLRSSEEVKGEKG